MENNDDMTMCPNSWLVNLMKECSCVYIGVTQSPVLHCSRHFSTKTRWFWGIWAIYKAVHSFGGENRIWRRGGMWNHWKGVVMFLTLGEFYTCH